jgi:hypothetical protein
MAARSGGIEVKMLKYGVMLDALMAFVMAMYARLPEDQRKLVLDHFKLAQAGFEAAALNSSVSDRFIDAAAEAHRTLLALAEKAGEKK